MSQKTLFLPCDNCGETRPHLVDKANHVLHLLLTLVTFGLWLIPWLLIANRRPPAHCNHVWQRQEVPHVEGVQLNPNPDKPVTHRTLHRLPPRPS